MDMTALTQRDHVRDAIVGVVAVDVVQGGLVLASFALGGVAPLFRRAPAHEALTAPCIADCLPEVIIAHWDCPS
ncbi:unknown [Haloarcula marismortui ATCC 43049]|uniref:Uncharacterized protein n=1 Tax=Haloarcula marismortui (strain ATCC 43049 / DSM 3752 / JCM 8966 / VKM B-1809) TaxID=272569 RepID=Q5V1X0_HALMA|nr:unknown [Haloarcula marismortui ATCC 43049]